MSGFSFVLHSANDQTQDETLHVMTYELGRVVQCHHYKKRYKDDTNNPMGFSQFGESEMADLISMCRMYCEQKNWDYDKLVKLGEDRYLDKMEDLKNYGKKENLKEKYQ